MLIENKSNKTIEPKIGIGLKSSVLASLVLSVLIFVLTFYGFYLFSNEYEKNNANQVLSKLHKATKLIVLANQNSIFLSNKNINVLQSYLDFYANNSSLKWIKIVSGPAKQLLKNKKLDEKFLEKNELSFSEITSSKSQTLFVETRGETTLLVKIERIKTENSKTPLYYIVYGYDITSGHAVAINNGLRLAALLAIITFSFFNGLIFIAKRLNVLIDTSEMKEKITLEVYRHNSYHDTLTGLPNRTMFIDRILHSISKVDRQGEMLAVLYMNIDRFNIVNEGMGYQGGDYIVKQISERLKTAVRECDTIARFNGDEFAILLDPIGGINEAAHVAKRVQSTLARPYLYKNDEISLSASIGVSIYPNDNQNVKVLLSNADFAMRRAKKNGGSSFQFYTSDMNVSSSKRIKDEKRLRDAIENNEYVLYYQPKVSLRKGGMVGMEALIRWQKDENTLVAPGKFIGMMEENGLILPVGEWVLNRACEQNKQWIDRGYKPMTIAVNVSSNQFRQLDFVDVVCNALDKSGLKPEYLEIEVTEGVLMEDTQASITTLEELKEIGISIAIDDFGTGYSSLSYLQRYPIDTLKIDRGFIAGLENKSEDAAIATTIVALAHNLRLNIVAEGVENKKQMAFLNAVGCHELQGYLFSEPLCAEEFEKYLIDGALLFRNLPDLAKNRA